MICLQSESVITPLGFSSEEVFRRMAEGESSSALQENCWGLPVPFWGSLMNEELLDEAFARLPHLPRRSWTRFEKLVLAAAWEAVEKSGIDASSPEVLFVLSTTKGNVALLENAGKEPEDAVFLWHSAELLGTYFHNPNKVLVVSNACISGVAAQWTACRLMECHPYRYAVVVGADALSKFVVSGFQSFKALSPERCRPFDAARCGLNLGEASACMLLQRVDHETDVPAGTFFIRGAAVTNDANHISGPSRTGEGLFQAVRKTIAGFDNGQLAFINAHGTATLYNDDMESFAISRSGLNHVPVNSLKPFLGHTLGAAGVLECLISMESVRRGLVLGVKGFETPGVCNPLRICAGNSATDKSAFLKLISGFGGCNAAILWQRTPTESDRKEDK